MYIFVVNCPFLHDLQVLAAYEEMLRVQEEEKAKAHLVDPEVRSCHIKICNYLT